VNPRYHQTPTAPTRSMATDTRIVWRVFINLLRDEISLEYIPWETAMTPTYPHFPNF